MAHELMNFLRKENKLLKEEVKELRELLQLNREALQVTAKSNQQQAHYTVLFKLLFEENSKLHRKIKELNIELETGMCKALISEQIAFASTEHEKYLTQELKDRLKKMRKELEQRDKKIIELTKADSEKKHSNSSEVKVIQITELNTVTKKLKDQVFSLKNELESRRQEVFKYRDQKEDLLRLNLILTKQINELKFITSQQSTDSKDMRGSGSGDMSKFMSYQQKIVRDEDDENDSEDYQFEDSDSEFSEQPEENPNQVSKISKVPKLDTTKVPKLQLSKAKEIQDLIIQKINNDDNKKKGVMKEDRVKKMDAELTMLRKKVGQMALERNECEKQNAFLKKFLKELENRNELLAMQRGQRLEQNEWYQQDSGPEETETLLDICRDVTMNQLLRDVVKGVVEVPHRKNIVSADI